MPPSATGSETLYFHSIYPPGLLHYTNTLFSFFLPAFRTTRYVSNDLKGNSNYDAPTFFVLSSTQPHRCPSVLLTGGPGIGKRTIVKAVARRCRMHVIEVMMHRRDSYNYTTVLIS